MKQRPKDLEYLYEVQECIQWAQEMQESQGVRMECGGGLCQHHLTLPVSAPRLQEEARLSRVMRVRVIISGCLSANGNNSWDHLHLIHLRLGWTPFPLELVSLSPWWTVHLFFLRDYLEIETKLLLFYYQYLAHVLMLNISKVPKASVQENI